MQSFCLVLVMYDVLEAAVLEHSGLFLVRRPLLIITKLASSFTVQCPLRGLIEASQRTEAEDA
jgi:hypothetical protein